MPFKIIFASQIEGSSRSIVLKRLRRAGSRLKKSLYSLTVVAPIIFIPPRAKIGLNPWLPLMRKSMCIPQVVRDFQVFAGDWEGSSILWHIGKVQEGEEGGGKSEKQ